MKKKLLDSFCEFMHYDRTPHPIGKNAYEFDGTWFVIRVTFNSKGFVEKTDYDIPEVPLAAYIAKSWSRYSTEWGSERCATYWENYK